MQVRVFQAAKGATQSGRGQAQLWRVEPLHPGAAPRDPLMGWVGACGTLTTLCGRLAFSTVDDAVAFARRQGWSCFVETSRERRVMPRSYTDNFRITRPQDEEREAARVAAASARRS